MELTPELIRDAAKDIASSVEGHKVPGLPESPQWVGVKVESAAQLLRLGLSLACQIATASNSTSDDAADRIEGVMQVDVMRVERLHRGKLMAYWPGIPYEDEA